MALLGCEPPAFRTQAEPKGVLSLAPARSEAFCGTFHQMNEPFLVYLNQNDPAATSANKNLCGYPPKKDGCKLKEPQWRRAKIWRIKWGESGPGLSALMRELLQSAND